MDDKKWNREIKQDLYTFLSDYITENKKSKFEEVLRNRTRHVTVVLEDLYQSHNASAVLRSCDCFGVQDVHIIENRNEFQPSKDVALGSSKWLNLYKYKQKEHNTKACFDALRANAYKIYATSPHKDDILLDNVPLDEKIAFVFGTELEGLSGTAMKEADHYVKIPMYGFTESFNISVSAAILLHSVTNRLRKSRLSWKLRDDELLDIKLDWARKVIRKCEVFEKQFLKQRG
ncbi:MAG: RNA methyltransferase [Bacteroidales bacterium]|nr:RNA methyltransferase [Bacteroidales bacterium]MCF8396966.1 RNA methyltransferase [Bacteroidales bacterium]